MWSFKCPATRLIARETTVSTRRQYPLNAQQSRAEHYQRKSRSIRPSSLLEQPIEFTIGMDSKPTTDQQFRCKTLNCSKSFKNASSLFRHNKCCIRFGRNKDKDKDYTESSNAGSLEENNFVNKFPDIEPKAETFNSSNDNGTRDATCLCEPGDEKTAAYVTSTAIPVENGVIAGVDQAAGEEPAAKKNKKQVILNPDGEDAASERYNHEDLVIDEAQAAKLESYSCYAGVPQRDKAGDLLYHFSS